MEWLSYLLVLVCPIMMLFMMKGHGGHKHGHNHSAQDIELKITNLEKENKELHKKLENLLVIVKKES